MITLSLAQYLLSNAAITAVTTDIKPQVLDDDHGEPAMTYQLIYDENDRTWSGSGTINRAQFQIDCYSTIYSQVKTLADTVRNELETYSGAFGAHTAQQIDFDQERDIYESQTKLHRVMLTFSIWYNEV